MRGGGGGRKLAPMNPDLVARVRTFVAGQAAVRPDRVRPETTLFGDLGVDGDDGSDLMAEFANEFQVDISGFDHAKHFGPEASGCFPPTALFSFLFRPGRDPHHAAGKVPITIRDLVEAAERGQWSR